MLIPWFRNENPADMYLIPSAKGAVFKKSFPGETYTKVMVVFSISD
jgi:hypothetical protein